MIEQRIRSEFEALDPDLRLTVEPVSEIRPEGSGKLRFVRSGAQDDSHGASPSRPKSIERCDRCAPPRADARSRRPDMG